MSVEAITWALNLAPVPMDEGRRKTGGKQDPPKPNSACAFVLVGLANHADPDGTNAFPGVDTIVRYTRLSERTVRTALDRLEQAGVITPCDPDVIAAKIKRADRRPNGYDLNFALLRDDLSDTELTKIGKDHPWLRPWIEQHLTLRGATVAGRERGATVAGRDERGATVAGNGVQPLQERGATAAPEPSLEPSTEPSISSSPPADLPPWVSAAAAAAPSVRFVEPETEEDDTPHLTLVLDEAPTAPEPTFDDWWKVYPKRVVTPEGKVLAGRGRKSAEGQWERAIKKISPTELMAATIALRDDPNRPGGENDPDGIAGVQYLPDAERWLKYERWNDGAYPPRGGSATRSTYSDQRSFGVSHATGPSLQASDVDWDAIAPAGDTHTHR